MNEEVTLTFHRIRTISDPVLPDVFDIYQQSFPHYEQIRASYFLRYLHSPDSEENNRFHYYCLKSETEIIGFSFFEIGDEVRDLGKPGYIWYLGIREDKRGTGLGVVLYNHIRRFVVEKECCALTYEIELEDEIRGRIGEEAARNAARRRTWYKNLGAKAIGGIHYQYEGGGIWEVMVHPFNEIAPQDALDLAMGTIDGAYQLTGEVSFQ